MKSKFVYFIRHGAADWPHWKKPDDERPLTRHGRSEAKKVAKFLKGAGAKPQVILTSPLPRAGQTATILGKRFGLTVQPETSLRKGFSADNFRKLIRSNDCDCLVLVGHEPDFTRVIDVLTGANVVLAKSGVALVEVDPAGAAGQLRWLFPPRLAKRR